MSAFTNAYENGSLLHYFNNVAMSNVGDASGLPASATAGSLYVTMHTLDPGEAGSQNTNGAAYTNYIYLATARSSAAWTVSGNQVSNAAAFTFAECGVTGETEMFWGVGRSSSGAGTLDFKSHIGAPVKTFVVEAADLTGNDITCPSHGYINDDRVVFYATMGSTLPTGITEGTVYFVLAVTTDTFTISTTQDGSAVDITAVGAGVVGKVTPRVISEGTAPNFAIGALTLTLF